MMTPVITFTRIVGLLFLVAIAVTAGSVGAWVADREPPIKMVSTKALNEPKPGEELVIEYVTERYRNCGVTVERFIFDGQSGRIILPELSRAHTGPLGPDTYRVRVPVSTSAAPGPSRYRVTLSFRCNPINLFWPIVYPIPDTPFTIAAR